MLGPVRRRAWGAMMKLVETTRAARVQLDRLASDMPAARSTSTRTLRVCVADCALLDRGLGRQRRVFRGMEPLFRVTTSSTHVVAGGRGRGHVLWPYPPRLRPVLAIVGKRRFSRDVFSYLELMEVGEGRTKKSHGWENFMNMLPPNQIWAHNSFSFKSYACTFAGKLLLISTT